MTDLPAPKLGWTILHVADVAAAVSFYEKAFGLKRRFIHPEGEYAEMETGSTALAFSANSLIDRLALPGESTGGKPEGAEIALIYDEAQVEAAFRQAIDAGAELVKQPEWRPWGQVVGFVRDPDGFLVEICTTVTGG